MPEQEVPENNEQEEDNSKDSNPNKGKFINILALIGKVSLFLFAILVVIPLTSYLTFKKSNEISQSKKEKLNANEFFTFPKVEKLSPRASFSFGDPGIRRPKEIVIKLTDLSTIVTTEIYLGYDRENTNLGEELTKRKLEILSKIRSIIEIKNYYDINTADKRKFNLKKEIINEINSLLNNGKIDEFYFTQFQITRVKKL